MVLVVVISGIGVGAILRIRSNVSANVPQNPDGQVEGLLTVASPIPTVFPSNTPESIVLGTPTPTLDPDAEGAPVKTATPNPTTTPLSTPTPTIAPTSTPDEYDAKITDISGSNPVNVTVNVKKNNNNDCGETVSLISNPAGVNFNQSTCSDGNINFSATSTNAGTYSITAQVYGQSYGTSSIVFN